MNEQRMPSDDPGSSYTEPGNSPTGQFNPSSSLGLKVALAALVLVAVIAVAYGWLQHNSAAELASERADLRNALAQAKSQQDALTAKVNSLSAAQAQAEAARAQAEAQKNEQLAASSEAPQRSAHRAAVRRPAAEDLRWKQFQGQLGDQQKQLAESQKQIAETQANLDKTRTDLEQAKTELAGNLQSTRTELGGDIARNHAELIALQKKGERNYYEFQLREVQGISPHGAYQYLSAQGRHQEWILRLASDRRRQGDYAQAHRPLRVGQLRPAGLPRAAGGDYQQHRQGHCPRLRQ